jgi:hypothetical protein
VHAKDDTSGGTTRVGSGFAGWLGQGGLVRGQAQQTEREEVGHGGRIHPENGQIYSFSFLSFLFSISNF